MANFFNSVRITNFKSLKDVTLSDCKRINVLIGKPNVGKSNILEAIGLLGLPYFKYNKSKKFTQFVRLESIAELFFDGNIDEKITINTDDNSSCTIDYDKQKGLVQFQIVLRDPLSSNVFNSGRRRTKIDWTDKGEKLENVAISIEMPDKDVKAYLNVDVSKLNKDVLVATGLKKTLEDSIKGLPQEEINAAIEAEITRLEAGISCSSVSISLDNRLNLTFTNRSRGRSYSYTPKVNFYKFPQAFAFKKPSIFLHNLLPPSGANLLEVIEHDKLLENELSGLFAEYGLNLLLDKTNQTVRVMKTLKDNKIMVSFPYSSIADTLQRVIFFKAAIASNKNSILLFEEPEAHCFPPYITHIARKIIDSESNQFFIATHSPYILDTFLEYERDDLAIYMADFKDGQTIIKRLTDAELNDVFEYGLDLFFNAELFTDEI